MSCVWVLFKQGIVSPVVGTLWELRKEIKPFPCHQQPCASVRVEAEAIAETPCEISSQVISFLCCKSVDSVKFTAETNPRGMLYRNSEAWTSRKCSTSPPRLKSNTEIILRKLKCFFHISQFWGFVLKLKKYILKLRHFLSYSLWREGSRPEHSGVEG